MKVAFEMHARQPDVELIKDLSVRHTDRAKQFRLGNFKEANVRALEDDVGGVNITPTHAFFNGELLGLSHRLIVSLIQLFEELPHRLIKYFRLFHIHQVTCVLNCFETRAFDTNTNRLSIDRFSYAIIASCDDQSWNGYLWQVSAVITARRHAALRRRSTARISFSDHFANTRDNVRLFRQSLCRQQALQN